MSEMSAEELLEVMVELLTPRNLLVVLVTVTSSLALRSLVRYLSVRQKRLKRIKEVKDGKQKMKERVESLENNDNVNKITSLSLSQLRNHLQSGELKPTECLQAYQAKAVQEDAKYNFVVDYIQEAEEDAKALEESSPNGSLYGIPVSVKDHYNVKGYETCCGMSQLCGVFWPEDSVLVQVLKRQGAVVFMKTNVPQTLMSYDCGNPIQGQTRNPHDPTRAPGGSSGGEAAALTCNASVLGFGSDIAGSCRVPACYFCRDNTVMSEMSAEELLEVMVELLTPRNLLVVLVTVTTTLAVRSLVRYLSVRQKRLKRIKEVKEGKQKMKERVESLENNDNVNKITSLSLSQLRNHLQSGELKPTECLQAYQAKAVQEDAKYNFVVDYIQEAEEDAKALEESSPNGSLYGIPVSVKDHYNVKGYESCCGMSQLCGVFWPEDSVLVQVLKRQGAVVFMKTNVPQTLMSYDCGNPIQGQTRNPHDPTRAPGGSSGGEAAALTCNASVLGFGSDIAGSCRVPACYCGICGFKPSAKRLSKKGMMPFCAGNLALQGSIGPLARDVDSLAIAMKSVLVPDMFELDPDVPPLPFNNEVYKNTRPLRIGFFAECEGVFPTLPASRRAVLLAKQALEKLGHEVVPWQPHEYSKGITDFMFQGLSPNQSQEVLDYMRGDSVSTPMQMTYYTMLLPRHVKLLLAYLLKPLSPFTSIVLRGMCGLVSLKDEIDYTVECEKWRKANMDHWNAAKLDAVISPGAGPALPIGYPDSALPLFPICTIYNLLNFTSGVLPVTKVTQEDEDAMKDLPVNDMLNNFVKNGLSKGTVGLPVSVHVATLPYRDEQCLRVMKEIESVVDYQ